MKQEITTNVIAGILVKVSQASTGMTVLNMM
jgi:hypothetical protein